jgi:GTP-binding protein
VDPNADPVRDARAIVGELGKFSEDLLSKPRWLVINKSDLLPPEEATAKAIAIAQELDYPGPVFLISGVTRSGTTDLTEAVMRFLETAEAPTSGNLDVPRIPRPVAPPPKTRRAPPRKKAGLSAKKAPKKKLVKKSLRKSAKKKAAVKPRKTRKAKRPAPRRGR